VTHLKRNFHENKISTELCTLKRVLELSIMYIYLFTKFYFIVLYIICCVYNNNIKENTFVYENMIQNVKSYRLIIINDNNSIYSTKMKNVNMLIILLCGILYWIFFIQFTSIYIYIYIYVCVCVC